jgi:hypothetical protein
MEVFLSSTPIGRKAWRWVFSITTLAAALAIPVTSWASELPKSLVSKARRPESVRSRDEDATPAPDGSVAIHA